MPTTAAPPALPPLGDVRGTWLISSPSGMGVEGSIASGFCAVSSAAPAFVGSSSPEKTPATARTTTTSRIPHAAQRRDGAGLPGGEARALLGGQRLAGRLGRGRGLAPAEAAARRRLRQLRQLRGGKEGRELGDDLVRQFAVGRVLAQVPDRVGAPDRVGLAQEIVAQANVAIRVGAAQLLERCTGPLAGLALAEPEEVVEVGIGLTTRQEHLENGALVGTDRHGSEGMDSMLSSR